MQPYIYVSSKNLSVSFLDHAAIYWLFYDGACVSVLCVPFLCFIIEMTLMRGVMLTSRPIASRRHLLVITGNNVVNLQDASWAFYSNMGFVSSAQVRSIISDFAVFITILTMVLVDYALGIPSPKLQVPSKFKVRPEGGKNAQNLLYLNILNEKLFKLYIFTFFLINFF